MEIKNFEEEQNVEERQRVAVIHDLHQRVEMQRASDQAWAEKVEEAQAMVDGLVKKARTNEPQSQFEKKMRIGERPIS